MYVDGFVHIKNNNYIKNQSKSIIRKFFSSFLGVHWERRRAMENYNIIDNKLVVQFDPLNEIEEFASFCHDLLDLEYEDLVIYFSDKVFFLSSQYIGVLMMTVAGAKRKGKSITISCTNRLGRILCILGGGMLNFDLRQDLVKDTSSYELLGNED